MGADLRVRGSIRRQLTRAVMLTTILALVLAGLLLLLFELGTRKRAMVRSVSTLADIIASNSTAAMAFGDQPAAEETLGALRSETQILAACVYSQEGSLFASYARTPTAPPCPAAPEADGARFGDGRLIRAAPIVLDRERIGTIVIMADLKELHAMLALHGGAILLTMIASALVALALSSRLLRVLARPILDLAGTAHQVSSNRDYSLRALKSSDDEVGVAVDAFNEMLAAVQARDAALRTAISVRDDFLSVASHELKTPLTTLQLDLHTLVDACRTESLAALGPNLAKIVGRSQRQVERLSALVDNLLDVTRIAAGRLALTLGEVDLAATTRLVIERFGVTAARAGSVIELRAEEPVVGRWDGFRLEQVVTNLLSNAIKYGAGKPIEVTVDAAEGMARLAVRDHGIGIPPGDVAHIFERFGRAVSPRHYAGLGLGLYITRQIVEAHDGTLRVTSQPGAGSTFTIELPIQPRDAGHPAPPKESAHAVEPGRGEHPAR